MRKMWITAFVLGVYCVVFSGASYGRLKPTAMEWIAWPPYCKAKMAQGGGTTFAEYASSKGMVLPSSQAIRRWKNTLGNDTFVHVHHACYGFALRNRARMARTKQERDFIYNQAFRELSYTYRQIPKATSPLLPKISREIAEIKFAQGKPWEALKYLDDAIRYQPNNVYVYREKANYLIKQEEYDRALNTLKKGIDILKKENKTLLALMSKTALKAKYYESAREYARRAYEAGYKGKKLKKLLEKAGYAL